MADFEEKKIAAEAKQDSTSNNEYVVYPERVVCINDFNDGNPYSLYFDLDNDKFPFTLKELCLLFYGDDDGNQYPELIRRWGDFYYSDVEGEPMYYPGNFYRTDNSNCEYPLHFIVSFVFTFDSANF